MFQALLPVPTQVTAGYLLLVPLGKQPLRGKPSNCEQARPRAGSPAAEQRISGGNGDYPEREQSQGGQSPATPEGPAWNAAHVR